MNFFQSLFGLVGNAASYGAAFLMGRTYEREASQKRIIEDIKRVKEAITSYRRNNDPK